MSDGEWKYVPPAYEMADSLLNMAQHVEIGKTKFTAPAAAFLREAADRIQRQHAEIERLREALKSLLEYEPTRDDYGPLERHDRQYESAKATFKRAREALGDE